MKFLPLRPRPRFLATLLLVVVTLLVFAPTLSGDFVEWDDNVNFLKNEGYRGLTLGHLRWIATATVMGHYIPLTWLTLSVDYSLWGMDARGYHLTSLVLHLGAVLTFLAVALRLLRHATALGPGPRLLAATVAALFFAVHPLRAESVAWVTERRDVLSGLFFLLTILAYLAAYDAAGARRRWLLTASAAAFLAGTLSKSIIMGLPLILLVLDIYPLRRLDGGPGWLRRSRGVLLEKIPFVTIGLACALTAYLVVKTFTTLTPLESFPWQGRVAMVFYTLWFYLGRTLFPVALSPLYELPTSVSPLEPGFALIALGVIAFTVALVVLRRRWPGGLAAWACYAIVLAPISGVVHAGLQLAHDRYSYLSCLGWALLLGGAVGTLIERPPRALGPAFRRAALGAVAVWLVTLAWLGNEQARVWRDTPSLWSHAVNVDPGCSVCHGNLAAYYVNHDLLDAGLRHAQIAMTLRPDRPRPYGIYGQALVKAGQSTKAIPYFERFLAGAPESADVSGLGLALFVVGRTDEAVAALARGVARAPENSTVRVNYAAALMAANRREDALREYREAIARDPLLPAVRYGFGWAMVQLGDLDGARREHAALKVLDRGLAARLAREIN